MANKNQTKFVIGKKQKCPYCGAKLVEVGQYFCCNECNSIFNIITKLANGIQVKPIRKDSIE